MDNNGEYRAFDKSPYDSTLLSVGAWAEGTAYPGPDLLSSVAESLTLPHTEKADRSVESWLHIATLFGKGCNRQLEQATSDCSDHTESVSTSDSGQEPAARPWITTMPFRHSPRAKVNHPYRQRSSSSPNRCLEHHMVPVSYHSIGDLFPRSSEQNNGRCRADGMTTRPSTMLIDLVVMT